MKKIISILLTLVLILSFAVPAFSADTDFVIEYGKLTKYTGEGGDIKIPEEVRYIERDVFKNNLNITSVEIPKSVRTIGKNAFSGCSNLKSVSIAEGVTEIGIGAFSKCIGLTNIALPDSVKIIDDSAFASCYNLSSVKLPNGLEKIGGYAFSYCENLTNIEIPKTIEVIGGSAFIWCKKLENVTLSDGNIDIRRFAFAETPWYEKKKNAQGDFVVLNGVLMEYRGNDKEITIPDKITRIGDEAFKYNEDIQAVYIPDGVVSIGDEAFYGCWFLFDAYIPKSVTDIGRGFEKLVFAVEELDKEEGNVSYYSPKKNGLLKIHGAAGSSAEQFANRQKLMFAADYSPAQNTETVKNTSTVQSKGFADVSKNDYYYDSVQWAVSKAITSGTSANEFSPNKECTHGQIITFLWRAAGSPNPVGSAGFANIDKNAYYAKAVDWAAEKGIITGSTFSADAPCTRLAAVEYMWRYAGSPVGSYKTAFYDVSSPAVDWAMFSGVTGGTGFNIFSPDMICTRGQIVTFLYRGFA